MPVDRDYYIGLMRRIGRFDEIATAEQVLPRVVDRDRDRGLLERLGLDDGELMQELGSSP
jgi:hypothetical protein